jgi:hypothetical protein
LSTAVNGAEVGFGGISYREWMATWPDSDSDLVAHRAEILKRLRALTETIREKHTAIFRKRKCVLCYSIGARFTTMSSIPLVVAVP